MLENILASFGSTLGKMLGGGILSTSLRFTGKFLGNYLTYLDFRPEENYSFQKHLNSINLKPDAEGAKIPLIYGKARIHGRIIWSLDLREESIRSTKVKYSKRIRKISKINHRISYKYFADFALGLAEGEIDRIDRFWINNVESNLADYKYRFYHGNEAQLPDSLIERHLGPGTTPAFRGLSYIVFEDFPLEDFNNRIPIFEFELYRKIGKNLGEKIENINIIPGSGEFVYDTRIIEKIYYSKLDNEELYREKINNHNEEFTSDAISNLEQLKQVCPNVKWASPVVCWFGNNLDIKYCDIEPAIEHRDQRFSEEWIVGEFNRERAKIISKNEDNIPNYGGTISDESLMRFLKELQSRNIKIMLYPILQMDLPNKPWRGNLFTSSPEAIQEFFNKERGYKNFILHYANLTKDYVDAFIIGSELKNITSYNNDGYFPAIDELIDLASKVKNILGDEKIVTYAADWSEYHHHDGYYHLDKLWASKYIDVVGIDAYFPLTDSSLSNISKEEIKKGWVSGEGFDYYLHEDERNPLDPAWAWKNIEYWWSNYHIDKNGRKSDWVPKSKKIWFTEMGFASIDKTTNQPNIFYDPNSLEGGIPKYSNGNIDFTIQRRAIETSLEFWSNSTFVEKIFIWAWDARPYPSFPHLGIWDDSYLWSKGHYINGKINVSPLSDIIMDLCARACINSNQILINDIDEYIEGIIFNKDISIFDAISILRTAYFFDIKHRSLNNIEFISRKREKIFTLNSGDCVRKGNIFDIREVSTDDILSKISIEFTDINYESRIENYSLEDGSNISKLNLHLPIILHSQNAEKIASRILNSAFEESKICSFTILSIHIIAALENDMLDILYRNINYRIRVTDIRFELLYSHIEGFILERYYLKPETYN